MPISNSSWFAVRVKSRCEWAVADALRHKGYEEFLPLYWSRRRWSDRVKLCNCRFSPVIYFAVFLRLTASPFSPHPVSFLLSDPERRLFQLKPRKWRPFERRLTPASGWCRGLIWK